MTDLLQLVLSGMATGSIYALAALGFTLLWQASGTVNFAQGEFVMLPAFAMLAFGHFGLPLPAAFLATCVLAVGVLGWGFKRGIADPLLRHGLMPVVVATIGLAIAMRNGIRVGYSAEAHPFPSLFADRLFHLGGVTVSLADAGTLALAMALVLGTQAFLARTVTGRAMQAVAQNTESATVLGIDVPRMVFYTFAINAVLACAAALLVTPAYLAKFDMGESLGTKAFFAAIIGGFSNSRGALLGGVLVGICENLAAAYISPAYKDAVALVLFMAVILFKPQGLLGLARSGRSDMDRKLAFAAGVLALAALLAVPPFLKNYGVYLFSYWLVFVIATMGLNLTVGYAGQKSLGHAAFFGIGAYTVAIVMKAGFSFWLGLPLAMAGCFVVGLALGFPALRVQTLYLAFATLGFNTAVWLVLRNEEWLTGGTFGINGIPRPGLFGLSLDKPLAFYYFILGTTLLLALLLWRLLASPWGKAFTALRDNPIRAESLGVSTRSYTLLAFAIGAVYAGVAGALFAPLVEFIEPAPFQVSASIMMYLMVVVGGAGYFFGPMLGAAVGVLLPEWLRFAQGWYLFVFGLAVVALMLWLPDGLLSIPERLRARRHARRASAAAAAAVTAGGQA